MKNVNLITSSRRLFFMMAMSAGMTLLPQELLAVQNSIQAVQQDNHVEGVVKDTNGEPIIGATVRVVGTKTATVTDFDGNFKLNAKSGQSLQITYVGCKPKTVKVSRGAINVVLEDDSQVLKDVQVVAYGVQKKVTVTGAISNIKGEELTKVFSCLYSKKASFHRMPFPVFAVPAILKSQVLPLHHHYTVPQRTQNCHNPEVYSVPYKLPAR